MAPKPFGKPVRAPHRIPVIAWLAFVVLLAAPIVFFALSVPARARRPFNSGAFFWPSATLFGILFAFAWRAWIERHPKPVGPEGPPWYVRAGRLLVPLVLAAPFALAGAFLYDPALGLLNGTLSLGDPRTAHALVEVRPEATVLRSPYWPHEFQIEIYKTEAPPGIPSGSLARLTLTRGLLGALWIQRIDYEEFR